MSKKELEYDNYGRPYVDPKGSRTFGFRPSKNYDSVLEIEIIEEFKESIEDAIEELFDYEFSGNLKNMEIELDNDNYFLYDMLHELIDQSQYVIYTNKSKEVVECLNYYTPFCENDITGEQFKSYNECAYANIYQLIIDNLDLEDMTAVFIAKTRQKQNNE
jgi:hypothetical protein